MSAVPYIKRKLAFSFQLGESQFGNSGFNTISLPLLRATAEIQFAIMGHPGQAVARIYGMTLSQMNALSVAGLQYRNRNNKILIKAGDDKSGMTTVFNGLIIEAYPDFQNQPDCAFTVMASPGPGINLPPSKPVTFNQTVSVETALTQIVKPAGYTIENNGVNVQLAYPYFAGSVMAQAMQAIKAADCMATVDSINNKIAIWPKNSGRNGDAVVVSPETGMIGYPKFEQAQIKVRTLFDPAVQGVGTKIQVKSQLTAANGKWNLMQIDYSLSCEMAGGPWEMTLTGFPDQDMAGGSNSAATSNG